MPILINRKDISESFIHEATFVRVLFEFFGRSVDETRSNFSASIFCPDKIRLIIAFPCHGGYHRVGAICRLVPIVVHRQLLTELEQNERF